MRSGAAPAQECPPRSPLSNQQGLLLIYRRFFANSIYKNNITFFNIFPSLVKPGNLFLLVISP
jgi:hypothetical protein